LALSKEQLKTLPEIKKNQDIGFYLPKRLHVHRK